MKDIERDFHQKFCIHFKIFKVSFHHFFSLSSTHLNQENFPPRKFDFLLVATRSNTKISFLPRFKWKRKLVVNTSSSRNKFKDERLFQIHSSSAQPDQVEPKNQVQIRFQPEKSGRVWPH